MNLRAGIANPMLAKYDLCNMKRNKELLKRIIVDPEIFGGKPIIRGCRLAVEHVLELLSAGDTEETLLNAYPWLEKDDIEAAVIYFPKTQS